MSYGFQFKEDNIENVYSKPLKNYNHFNKKTVYEVVV
jgi:hypothetical protein